MKVSCATLKMLPASESLSASGILPAALVVLLLPAVALAQGRPLGGRGAAETNARREQVERETTHAGPNSRPVTTAERRAGGGAVAQVREDFYRTQTAYNGLVRALSAGGALDYQFVADSAAEINRRAARLRSSLALPRPEEDEAGAARGRQHGETELAAAEIRPAVVSLCERVVSFFTSPLFESSAALDLEVSRKASRDLDQIVELSERIKRSAAKLDKSAGSRAQKAAANAAHPDGLTPLMEAAAGGDVDRVRKLLARGADVNASDTAGYTALLHAAARRPSDELLRVLLDAGADVNARAKDGDTALLVVVKQIAHLPPDVPAAGVDGADARALQIFETLIARGARVDVKNREGETPLKLASVWAERFGRPRIMELLKKAGAKE